MSLVFKTIQTEGIAELSYLLGDDDEAIGAIFDPRADIDVYVDMAREAGLAITHVFETHIHADLVSGARELCSRLPGAKIFASSPCTTCHMIQGVSKGYIGPDLTHFGSRTTLAAGVLKNTPDNVAKWIAHPGEIKPGANMPALLLPGPKMDALVAYLESLK